MWHGVRGGGGGEVVVVGMGGVGGLASLFIHTPWRVRV